MEAREQKDFRRSLWSSLLEVARGGTRSVSPVIRAKPGCVERVSVDVSVDKLNALRVIGNKMRRCIFADRVTKGVSECVMGCVSEYEELMMRMIAKKKD